MTHVRSDPTHDVPAATPDDDVARDVVARVLARAGTAIHHEGADAGGYDGDQLDLAERAALRRVGGLSTELEDVSEVEYRQLRLERVVLVGIWSAGTSEEA